MSDVIDRRLNGKNKSAPNRERFLKRYKDKIKKAVTDSLGDTKSISDMDKGGDVSVKRKDIDEPHLGHGDGGERDIVIPGNDSYSKGDQFRRPRKGKGNGGAGDGDPFDDEFVFTLTKEEFLHYFFDGLELPDLVKRDLSDTKDVEYKRAGYTTSGCSSNLHILRSLRGALSRRIGIGGKHKKAIDALLIELATAKPKRKKEIELEIAKHQAALNAMAYLDPLDLRYRNLVINPTPVSRAVMFCIMDVSGSMGEEEKTIAKKFFILLYLFLHKEYKEISLVFIRHTTRAEEVTEHEFFYGQESGGTLVSPALAKMKDIIDERYPPDQWNIYGAQLSDGDNYAYDSPVCGTFLSDVLLPLCQYYMYVEIGAQEPQSLWIEYQNLLESHPNLAVRAVLDESEIYTVFAKLFAKGVTK